MQEVITETSKLTIFGTFPREIGFNRVWCPNKSELQEYLSKSNGVNKCAISVYQQTMRDERRKYGGAIPEGAVIDKVFCDMDGTYSYECFEILRDWLLERGYLFRVNLSGRVSKFDKRASRIYGPNHALGFHFYIFIVPNLIYHSASLRNVHEFLNNMLFEELEARHGIKKHKKIYKKVEKNGKVYTVMVPEDELPDGYIYSPLDRAAFGNASQMCTPTNTYNIKRRLYCVPLCSDDLFTGPKKMAMLVRKQRVGLKDTYIGKWSWDVPDDIQVKDFEEWNDIEPEELELFDINDDVVNNPVYPRCMKFIMSQEHPDYDARFWLAVYLREYGETYDYVKKLYSLFVSRSTMKHILMQEKTIYYVFKGSQKNRKMLNCNKLRSRIGFNEAMCQGCSRKKYNNAIYF